MHKFNVCDFFCFSSNFGIVLIKLVANLSAISINTITITTTTITTINYWYTINLLLTLGFISMDVSTNANNYSFVDNFH